MTESEKSTDSKNQIPGALRAHHPKIVSSKKKTVFVFSKNNDPADEEEDDSQDLYDFTEIKMKFRIVDDLED